ncbi:MAG: hypothetical protein ACYTKC_14360, partial [Planctomycetota bacterium]
MTRALDVGGLDHVPHDLLALAPLDEAIHALGHELQLALHRRVVVGHRVDVERHDVAALDVLRIVFELAGADTATAPVLVGD